MCFVLKMSGQVLDMDVTNSFSEVRTSTFVFK